MKRKIIWLFFIFIIMLSPYVYSEEQADQDEIMNSQKKSLNISGFIEEAQKYTQSTFEDLDIGELLNSAIKGDIDNKNIFEIVKNSLGKEVITSFSVIGSIIVIIVIHSILKSISEGLENKSISQITYYVQYILIVTLIMTNFTDILSMVRTSIQDLVGFMNSLIPILITLMLTTGSIASANVIQPVILVLITFIGNFVTNIIVPFILVSTALGIISNISDKVQIGKLSKFFNSTVIWVLGIVLTIFVGVISIEGSLSSSVDGITAKTAKAAVSNFIPVVGKILRRCCRNCNRM